MRKLTMFPWSNRLMQSTTQVTAISKVFDVTQSGTEAMTSLTSGELSVTRLPRMATSVGSKT